MWIKSRDFCQFKSFSLRSLRSLREKSLLRNRIFLKKGFKHFTPQAQRTQSFSTLDSHIYNKVTFSRQAQYC